MKYRHLFFDLDHTLWDFDTASKRTWQQLYSEHHLSEQGLPDFDTFFVRYCHHNDRLWERFRAGYIKREDLRWKRIWYTLLDFKVYQTALSHELSEAYLLLLPTQAVLMPGARELLDYCSNRYTLHLITNGFERTQRQKLQHSGIEHFFKEIFCSERCNSIKPQPEIFQYALRETGAQLQESLMIGDALDIDVLGAQRCGMDSVYFNPRKLPHNGKPTYEIAALNELLQLL
ncbi:MAG: YjjG family noncanonical pyrimidine nucleotidase [Bacteroidetes bacterium]|nr:YjjG family noncanonical pyrimidine nucleotidase [Bacteroidota bacterium]MBS1629356.1 YjjG family noncanonical pyrimidine nucleotidase [Bacteroidota bacterium]